MTQKAIDALLETSGAGNFRDGHPWLVAFDMLTDAHSSQQALPILFASKAEDAAAHAVFTHWTWVKSIDVVELHRGQWDSRCSFAGLRPINPIWEPIDSLLLKASDVQMEREQREGIRVSRQALDEHHIHPYAVCETPAFINENQAG